MVFDVLYSNREGKIGVKILRQFAHLKFPRWLNTCLSKQEKNPVNQYFKDKGVIRARCYTIKENSYINHISGADDIRILYFLRSQEVQLLEVTKAQRL
jgi:hypothetical protein